MRSAGYLLIVPSVVESVQMKLHFELFYLSIRSAMKLMMERNCNQTIKRKLMG